MNAVALAYRILLRFEEDPDANLRYLMQSELGVLAGARAAAPYRMVAGTIRHLRRLDFLLNHWSHIPAAGIEPEIRVLLRLGLHRLTATDSLPDHAAVNETVALAPPRARGFVNALLRRAAREGDAVTTRLLESITDPAVRFSIHPDLPAETERFQRPAGEILNWLNREPVFHLAPAPGRTAGDLAALMRKSALPHRRVPGLSLFQVDTAGPVLRALVGPGHAFIQNTASRLVSLAAARNARRRVLDACAAPGTKSLSLRALRPELSLVVNDLRWKRLARVPGAEKGIDSAWHRTCGDMNHPPFHDVFDLVILDAPCTSIGTARKNPDLKLRTGGERIAASAEVQRGLLNAVLDRFPGASVLYSVCSFARVEGEGVLEAVAAHRSVETADLAPWARALGFNLYPEGRGVTLLPTEEMQNDLFYLALIKRASG